MAKLEAISHSTIDDMFPETTLNRSKLSLRTLRSVWRLSNT